MGSRKKQTVGYRYFMGLHMGLCRGPVDELVEIKVGDRTAWSGSITASGATTIAKPGLFGGDDKEGGIDGSLAVLMGEPTQPVHTGLAAMLGGRVPAFRGFVSLFFDGLVCSGSPYPKPWKMRVRRALAGWDGAAWYGAKAVVPMAAGEVKAMNPAHILYECHTNRDWGRGMSAARLDDAAWRAAADMLYAEGFGLCLKWSRQDNVSSFIQMVIDHIGAVIYTDRSTGLIVLRLIRGDYTPGALPLFEADSGLLGVDDDDAGSQSGATNEVVVRYRNPITNEDGQVRVRNLAAIHVAGGSVNSASKDYPGLPTAELALRVAQRDLRASAGFVKKYKLRLDRRGYALAPGSVFRIKDLKRGIDDMVLRAGRVEYGTLTDATITITALQDVFALPATSYVAVQPSGYEAPDVSPKVVTNRRIVELPYRDLAAGLDPANLAGLAATAGYLGAIAQRPSWTALGFDLLDRVGTSGDFVARGDGAFCPAGTLQAAIGPADTGAVVTGGVSLSDVRLGTAALIDDEIVRVDTINPATGELTLGRGCVDTVPAAHDIGARIYFYDGFGGQDATEYTTGVSVQAKLLTRTGAGVLAEAAAGTDTLLFAQRQARPYPPGRLRINSVSWPGEAISPLAVDWAHRDRVLQADQLVDTEAVSVGPEAGTTYTTTLKRADTLAVLDSQTGLSGPSVSITSTYSGQVILTVAASRAGLSSWQALTHTFRLADERLTEAGAGRIAEAGDNRITE